MVGMGEYEPLIVGWSVMPGYMQATQNPVWSGTAQMEVVVSEVGLRVCLGGIQPEQNQGNS
jgi:hypothetical protein